MRKNKKIVCFVALLCLLCVAFPTAARRQERNDCSWNRISKYFTPLPEYAGQYGEYASVLVFNNGKPVRTKAQWRRRRKEIKQEWMDRMGHWPALIKHQDFEVLKEEHRDNFRQYTVRFQWLPDQTTTGYLLVPDVPGRKPAVITVFYEPETAAGLGKKPNRDFALQLAKRGFVTLSIGTTETTDAKTYSLYYPSIEHAAIQPLSALACAASNALEVLARHKEVDPKRIGIVGHSYGGKWAMFSSCLNDKFACAVWCDPGIVFDETKGGYINYWEPWYLGYYPTPWKNTWAKNGSLNPNGVYRQLRQEGHDLHELHALMAPRPFLVSGGFSDTPDRWIPLNRTVEVNRLLGYEHRIGMTNRPRHAPNSESNAVIYDFFEHFLGPVNR